MVPTLQLLERHLDTLNAKNIAWIDVPEDCPFLKQGDVICNINWTQSNQMPETVTPMPTASLNILHYPKAKERLDWWLDRILESMPADALLWVVGDNQGGIKSLPKRLKDRFQVTKIDSARHCVLFEVSPLADTQINPEQWRSFQWNSLMCESLPGVFSAGRLDKGTELLLSSLPDLKGNALEFGCGCGVITSALAQLHAVEHVDAVDIDLLAVRSARATLLANHLQASASVHWSAGTRALAGKSYDAIVTNPPFHQGLKTSYAPTEQFFAEAHHWLKPGGKFIWVINDFLHYHDQLDSCFSAPEELARGKGFKVQMAVRRHSR